MSVECESCAKTCAFLSHLLPIPTRVFVSYIIDTAASANPFVRMKSVRVSLPHPLLGYCIARVTTCALCRKIVNKILNTDTFNFFFHSLVCGACKTGTLHPLFTVRSKRSSKMTANGRMAATSPRGMSCHLGRLFFHLFLAGC
jgi:hypothetical protein